MTQISTHSLAIAATRPAVLRALQKGAAAPDAPHLQRAAAHAAAVLAHAPAVAAPSLRPPGRDEPDRQETERLVAALDLVRAAAAAAAAAEVPPTAAMPRVAAAGIAAPIGARVQRPMDIALTAALAGHVRALSGQDIPASPTRAELESLRPQLHAAPHLQAEVDNALRMSDKERLEGFASDPRFAFVLQLLSMLLALAATQRAQGAAMIEFADRAIHAMGDRLVSSATERRTGAIIALTVATAVAGAGVAVSGAAAARNVRSIKNNELVAHKYNAAADKTMLKHAEGATVAPAGKRAELEHNTVLRATNQRNQANELQARHARNASQNAVATQGGHAVGQTAGSAGNIANAEYEVNAAEQNREAEIQRQYADTGRRISENSAQQAQRDDQERDAQLRTMQDILQAQYRDTAGVIVGNLSA